MSRQTDQVFEVCTTCYSLTRDLEKIPSFGKNTFNQDFTNERILHRDRNVIVKCLCPNTSIIQQLWFNPVSKNELLMINYIELSALRTYELSSGKLLNSFKSGSSEDSGMIVNVALDPSSTYLAAAGSDKCIFVHDLQSGDRLASLYGHSG